MLEPRLRILLVTRNLPPLVGGMERLNWHIAEELSLIAHVRVIAPFGTAALAPAGVEVIQVPLRPLWKFLAAAQWHAFREARHWRPALVLAGSGLTAVSGLVAARLAGARAAAYVHGLDVGIRHPLYRLFWLAALRRMDRVIANSQPTAALAAQAGVDCSRVAIVNPGVARAAHPVDPAATARLRSELGVGERPIILSVGRLSARKGMREFVVEAFPRIVAMRPDAVLLIVGDAPGDALSAHAQTPEDIRLAAARLGLADRLKFLGTITDDERLSTVYRAADVHAFPVREIPGDPEGFGMVAVEAAAHGLPTVAFATGGVVEAVAEGESGLLVTPGDYAAFACAVVDALERRHSLAQTCVAFGERYLWPSFGRTLRRELGLCSESEFVA